ncbi:hypothetical protein F5X99DRAFT_371110 [Biscogniauxia marginata]|nr:hypothetical protein F5X99DRAFT_371110 [Biscogniauxia marginata]
MEAVIQPTKIPAANYIGSQITLNITTLVVIAIRLWTNYWHCKKLFADDYLSVVALILVASYSATSSMMNSTFNSTPETVSLIFITRLAAACIFTATAAMYFAKLPLLILFLRSFGVKKWLRYTCYTLMVITAVGFLAAALYTGVNCSPEIHTSLGDPYLFRCVSATFYTTVSRNSLSLIVDMVIFVLPLPIVTKLKLPLRKKIGLALVFLTGTFALAAGTVSLYYQAGQLASTSSNITNAMLATVIECCIVIIVSCAPAFRLFWTHYLKKSSLFSQFSESSSTTRSKGSQAVSTPGGVPKSSSGPIRVTTHHYIELRDYPNTTTPSYQAIASSNQPQAYI